MSTNTALQQFNNFLADDQLNKTELLALIELAINIKKNPADY
ncbi:MAG: ornithine carbamoyltransferase, partial [Colwellia sp.]